MKNNTLDVVKQQNWFYEFTLPDGSRTNSYLPAFIRPIHSTREKVLQLFLEEFKQSGSVKTALDVSCHEGYYSLLLADHFDDVVGIDKNADSLDKAKLITGVMDRKNIRYVHTSLEAWEDDVPRDFVLCFGLLYHIENPVEVIRKLADLTKKAICIESQVLPIDSTMQIEDGYYTNQRETKGMFGLCMDYPDSKEGGLTELALVPSRDALVSLLGVFGFTRIRFYEPVEGDYEQFVRGHRVILYAEKK
jgi:ubiquinone/menaquinone biosynthesis C-methylase UbiE